MPCIQPTHFNRSMLRLQRRMTRAFTVVELLVVIGIILVLLGILLPALRGVLTQSKKTATTALMEDFGKAADAYYLEFGRYPGAVPGDILAQDPGKLSGTENVLLDTMGGVIRREDFPPTGAGDDQWDAFDAGWAELEFEYGSGNTYLIKVNKGKLGEGPLINGKQYEPFFTPKPSDLVTVKGQWTTDDPTGAGSSESTIPDLIDAWGQPIVLMMSLGGNGELVGAVSTNPGDPVPQFAREHIRAYVESNELGALQENQEDMSVFNLGTDDDQRVILAQAIRHPTIGASDQPLTEGQPRGRWVMFSAGPDGIYCSVEDGPGSKTDPINDIAQLVDDEVSPQVFEKFDDVFLFGGGGG